MSFGSPLALLALLAVPLPLLLLWALSRRPRRSTVAFTNLTVLEGAVRRSRSWRQLAPLVLILLALMLAAVAGAQPTAELPVRVNNATIVLLVDVSGSMSARDVEPTRLDAAVAAMRSFVDRLPVGFKVGLVQFSDTAQVLATPTDDHDSVRTTLGLLDAQAGTALGSGLATAVGVVKRSLTRDGVVRQPGRSLPAAIVLLSDGKQNQGRITPLQGARQARAAGIRVDTVALGTRHGILGYGPYAPRVAPDPPLMHAIAVATGGTTATAHNQEQLARFYRSVGTSFGHETRPRRISSWFLAAAAALLAVAVLLAGVIRGPLG